VSIIIKDKTFLTVQETADLLLVNKLAIYRYIKKGKIKAIKRFNKYYVIEESIADLMSPDYEE